MSIKIEKVEVMNLDGALRGLRNPLESWDKSDSGWILDGYSGSDNYSFGIGEKDLILANRLANAGNDHGKFLRQIFVCFDVTAPLYWYKEFDTYKVGTVANSTSTMHKLGSRDLTYDDFSWDVITQFEVDYIKHINNTIAIWRNDKTEPHFRQMIQQLLDSYNQTRTITLDYAVLRNQYKSRKDHKLKEWREYCKWIEGLPYAKELIIGKEN